MYGLGTVTSAILVLIVITHSELSNLFHILSFISKASRIPVTCYIFNHYYRVTSSSASWRRQWLLSSSKSILHPYHFMPTHFYLIYSDWTFQVEQCNRVAFNVKKWVRSCVYHWFSRSSPLVQTLCHSDHLTISIQLMQQSFNCHTMVMSYIASDTTRPWSWSASVGHDAPMSIGAV
jgi:hypothetical protein